MIPEPVYGIHLWQTTAGGQRQNIARIVSAPELEILSTILYMMEMDMYETFGWLAQDRSWRSSVVTWWGKYGGVDLVS